MSAVPAERGLTRVGVYLRVVGASVDRVWENVRDWEHLPWLHASSFAHIECVDSGEWGWRARIGVDRADPEQEILLELVIEPNEPRYVSRTLAGGGAGSEIWTTVERRGDDETAVEVEYWVPAVDLEREEAVGELFVSLYTTLWDEDEAMMMRRQRELDAKSERATGSADPVGLGPLEAVREQLPLAIVYQGRRFRIVEHDGVLVAHSTVCPHWLGPLDEAPVENGRVVCPWHGRVFDVTTGAECSGTRLKLARAPRVVVDPETREVWLEPLKRF